VDRLTTEPIQVQDAVMEPAPVIRATLGHRASRPKVQILAFREPGGRIHDEAIMEPDGTYALSVPPGKYRTYAWAETETHGGLTELASVDLTSTTSSHTLPPILLQPKMSLPVSIRSGAPRNNELNFMEISAGHPELMNLSPSVFGVSGNPHRYGGGPGFRDPRYAELKDLIPGSAVVTYAQLAGYGVSSPVLLLPGSKTQPLPKTLKLEVKPYQKVSGTVVTEAGDPIGDVYISVRSDLSQGYPYENQGDGSFDLKEVPHSANLISFNRRGYFETTMSLPLAPLPEGESLRVMLKRNPMVSVYDDVPPAPSN
jgi:hypothetical protein